MRAMRLAPSQLVVSLPEDLDTPIKIRAKHKVAGMLLLDRDNANRLDRSWNVPGAYILLDRPDAKGRWGAYVGKATNPGLRHRVLQQLKDRDHWYRALLIRYESNDDDTLNSAEAGWLEGELYNCLESSRLVDLHNRSRPQDPTLSDDDETSLFDYLLPIETVLHLIGHTLYRRNPNAPDGGDVPPVKTTVPRFPPMPVEPYTFESVLGLGTNPPIEAVMEKFAQLKASPSARVGPRARETST